MLYLTNILSLQQYCVYNLDSFPTLINAQNSARLRHNMDLPVRTIGTLNLLSLVGISQRSSSAGNWTLKHSGLLPSLQILEELD